MALKSSIPEASPSAPVGVDTASPAEVAAALGTTLAGLAQLRFRGTGPKFVRIGGSKRGRILYRWTDVRDYLDANTRQRTDDPGAA